MASASAAGIKIPTEIPQLHRVVDGRAVSRGRAGRRDARRVLAGLCAALAGGVHRERDELMANRNVLKRAYLAAGWRDGDGWGRWTWHSLRQVFCTTALFAWKLEATGVSRMAGHANVRTTLDMYVGSTAGVLDRARAATD